MFAGFGLGVMIVLVCCVVTCLCRRLRGLCVLLIVLDCDLVVVGDLLVCGLKFAILSLAVDGLLVIYRFDYCWFLGLIVLVIYLFALVRAWFGVVYLFNCLICRCCLIFYLLWSLLISV